MAFRVRATVAGWRGVVLMQMLMLHVSAACGGDSASSDAAGAADAGDRLPCGPPSRFQLSTTDVISMAATATSRGYAVFATNRNSGEIRGLELELSGNSLDVGAQNVVIGTSQTGAIAATSVGDNILLSSIVGMPATGTALHILGAGLAPVTQPSSRPGELAGDRPIATSGLSNALVFATVDSTSFRVDARRITPSGANDGAPVTIIPAAEGARFVTLGAAGSGYVAGYQTRGTQNRPSVVLVDESLRVVAGPVRADASGSDAWDTAAAWASRSDRYLVAWTERYGMPEDDVWLRILGPALEPVSSAVRISLKSERPRIASDGTGFWIAWRRTDTTPRVLEALYASPEGALSLRTVTGSGGDPTRWDVVERKGQPALVWIETGGTGPQLYVDPLCD